MNNISVIIFSIFNFISDLSAGLTPLGYYPSICVLIQTLLELEESINDIHVLVLNQDLEYYKKEISRWFYDSSKIFIHASQTTGQVHHLKSLLNNKKISLQKEILILYSNIPMISKLTIKDFILNHCQKNLLFSSILSKLKNIHSFYKTSITTDQKIISFGFDKELDYSILNTFLINKKTLEHYIWKLDNECEFINLVMEGSSVYIISPYTANKEFIMIQNIHDKNYAENIYLEKRNMIFIHQCYELWKKYESIEHRLNCLEQKNDLN